MFLLPLDSTGESAEIMPHPSPVLGWNPWADSLLPGLLADRYSRWLREILAIVANCELLYVLKHDVFIPTVPTIVPSRYVIVAGECEGAVKVARNAIRIGGTGPGIQLAAISFVLLKGALSLEVVRSHEDAIAIDMAVRVKGAMENGSYICSCKHYRVTLSTIRARKKERSAYGLVAYLIYDLRRGC
jgi:hypothetical protein